LLTIPQADQRTRAVAVIADRVSIDPSVDAFGLHCSQRVRKHLVARAAGFHSLHQQILQPVRIRKRALDSGGNIGLALAQDVAHVLGVGVEPERGDSDVAVEHITASDYRVIAELCIGLVHYTDGVEGTKKRIATAQKFFPDFSLATECGFGRRDPRTIPELLRIHAEVAELD
jgi:hypothetical protein